jgi:spermidine/putrescine transport system substrate-binding protein
MDFQAYYERLRERFGNGGIDRRTFLGHVGRMALGAGFVGSGMAPFARLASAAQTIRYDGYGGISQGSLSIRDPTAFPPN